MPTLPRTTAVTPASRVGRLANGPRRGCYSIACKIVPLRTTSLPTCGTPSAVRVVRRPRRRRQARTASGPRRTGRYTARILTSREFLVARCRRRSIS